jgi:hypothetical protein
MYNEITCQDDCKKLQSDLDAAARWEADWLMAFHPDKCTVLLRLDCSVTPRYFAEVIGSRM